MESRIEKLMEKYWQGETSIAEEEELKHFFASQGDSTVESRYWKTLQRQSKTTSTKRFVHPGKRVRQTWLSIAASLMIGITVAMWVINDARKQREFVIEDPQEAYEMTRKALLMLSTNLNEAAVYSESIKTINEPQELISENNDNKK